MPQNSKSVKKRNWAFVFYPDSMPSDWIEILKSTSLPIAISPLHNRDLNADGDEKKSHYHCILCWDGPVRFTQAERIAKLVNGTIPIPLESVKAYYRYFIHDDNPEKAQYDKSDILCLNGFQIGDYAELTKSEILKLKVEIIELINANGVTEYFDLINYLVASCNNELLEIATTNTFFFNSYLKSKRHKAL